MYVLYALRMHYVVYGQFLKFVPCINPACLVYNKQYTIYHVQGPMYNIEHRFYNVQYATYNVQHAMYYGKS